MGLLVLCVGFTAAGIWAIADPRLAEADVFIPIDIVSGCLAIVFFGAICTPPLVWKLVTPRSVVRVDKYGITTGYGHVAWNEIARIRRFSIQVLLELKKRAWQQRRDTLSWWRRVYDGANGLMVKGTVISMPRAIKDADCLHLQSWLASMHDAYKDG